jgi:hypothetical protein
MVHVSTHTCLTHRPAHRLVREAAMALLVLHCGGGGDDDDDDDGGEVGRRRRRATRMRVHGQGAMD